MITKHCVLVLVIGVPNPTQDGANMWTLSEDKIERESPSSPPIISTFAFVSKAWLYIIIIEVVELNVTISYFFVAPSRCPIECNGH